MRRYQTLEVYSLVLFLLLFVPAIAYAAPQHITLRFRYWGDFKEIAIIQQTIRAFERDHPNITVHGEREPSSGDEYVQKLLLEQAAGLTPDVIFCGNGNYSEFAYRGILADLTPFLKSDPSVKISDYYPQDVRAFTKDGKLYALPRDIAPMGLIYYNKKLFDQAHIPYPNGSWSWDYVPHPERGDKDFLTVCEKLTKKATANSPAIYGYGAGDTSWTMDNFIYSSPGGALVNNIYAPTKIEFGQPVDVKAIQLTQDMMYKYDVTPSPIDLQSSGLGTVGAHDLFAQGRLAMYLCGIWEVPRFRQEITNFDWDIAPFPMGPTGLKGYQTGYSGYGIAATSKHKQAAWELLKYLSGPIGLARLAKSGLAQPAIASLANSPLWLDGKRPKNRKLTIEEVPYVHFDVIDPDWAQIDNRIITPELQLVWNDSETAQQAVDRFLPAAQAKLDQLNHPPNYPRLNWTEGLLALLIVALAIVAWIWQGARADIRSGRKLGRRGESRAGYLFISPWIIGALVFLLAPMLISLLLSFSQWNMISPAQWVGAGNFVQMAQDNLFWKSLGVTFIYTLFSVPLGIVGSLVLALLLNAKIRGQTIFRTVFYLPAVASAVASALIWLKIFDPEDGLLNNIFAALHLNPLMQLLGLTDPTKGYVNWLGSEKTALASLIIMSLWGIGGGMVIFLAGLQGIPQTYYEAADLDGANVWQKFRHVTIPLLTPTIFFSLVIGIIGSFQVFTQGFVMTGGGPNNATLFYVLYLYQNAFEYLQMGYASALAWVLFLIILVFTIIQMKTAGWVHYGGAEAD